MKKFVLLSAMVVLCIQNALSLEYFDTRIDYWNKMPKESSQNAPPSPPVTKDSDHPTKEIKKFDWKKTLDPKNEEFFREGNHVPPAAFMELARDPSDLNIKNWFKLIEKKNKLSSRLQKRIAKYLKKNRKLEPNARQALVQNLKSLPQIKHDYKRFRFRMYFESSCPHCKRMVNTLKDLRDIGYFVEIKQIDKKPIALPFPTTPATKEELKAKNINAWPVLFIADSSKERIYRLNGFKSTQEILLTLQNK